MACTLLVSFLSILVHTVVTADNTTDYIHQLEQKISELESHTRAMEQKQAAVLASVLSRLQSQEQVIQENKEELQNLTNSNVTGQRIAFEASTTSDAMSTRITFDREQLNVGGGYDAHNGLFTAPTTGIYHFWFTVYVTERQFGLQPKTSPTKDNIVKLYAGKSDTIPSYGGYMAPEQLNAGILHINVRVVQGQHVVSLKAGETAYVHLVSSEVVKGGSSFGGMMLG